MMKDQIGLMMRALSRSGLRVLGLMINNMVEVQQAQMLNGIIEPKLNVWNSVVDAEIEDMWRRRDSRRAKVWPVPRWR